MNPNIFHAYDIRGIYPQELNEETAYKMAQAFAQYTKAKQILVGRDIRISSESLSNSTIKGINSQGVEVVDMELCSTPCFYFAVASSGIDAGIMITASHASKEFNGFKPVFKGAVPLSKEQITEFKNIVLNREFPVLSKEEKIIKKDFTQEYISSIRKFIKNEFKPLKIITDASNGMAGLYIEKVFAGTNLNVVPIFNEPDGNFPNHEANPKIPANRQKLTEKIISEKADLGFMFDGDADRVYALDREGRVIDPSLVSALISRYLINISQKKKVLIEVRTSRVVNNFIEKIGGKTEVSPCWTIPIKLKMKGDSEFIFGSETSGHYVFADFYWIDDGVLGMLNFLQAISVEEETIDKIINNFRKRYFIIEETNFKVKNGQQSKEILAVLENKYKEQGGKILKIDGLSVQFPDWWFNLRVSETEPLIRINLEAKTKELMEGKIGELTNLIKSHS